MFDFGRMEKLLKMKPHSTPVVKILCPVDGMFCECSAPAFLYLVVSKCLDSVDFSSSFLALNGENVVEGFLLQYYRNYRTTINYSFARKRTS